MTPTEPNEIPQDVSRALQHAVLGFTMLLVVVSCSAFASPLFAAGAAFAGIGLVGGWAFGRAREFELRARLDEVHRDADVEEKRRLNRTRDELEHEVFDLRETARALELDRQEATTASMAKGAFLAHMSHEIRTPLNGILGMTRLMGETELSREQRDFNATSLESAESLMKLLDDIVDLSKIEAGKLELEEADFDLHECFEKAVQLLVPKAAEKGLELICALEADVPRNVCGDGSRLRQIIVNLLGNAIKFTESGEVGLEVSACARKDGEFVLKFCVRDTGPGIPADRVHEIFEPFSQSGAPAQQFAGKGLGLAIGRQLAETMGGDMGVETQEGQGSLFWFTAALREVKTVERVGEVTWNALRGLRALVVDDNASQRALVRRYFDEWGVTCVDVPTRQQALAVIRQEHARGEGFHVAFIDSDLDGSDGIELAQSILQDQCAEPPQLVLLKDFRCQYKANRLMRIGFDAWISKPIWPNVLREALLHLRDVGEQAEALGAISGPPVPSAVETPSVTAEKFDLDVLLAEDNVVNQKVASLLLQKLGCSVDVASNGQKAIEAARAKRYDLIFMDCQMPVVDGYEATSAIRSLEHQGQVPILAMTASAMSEDRARSLTAGMDDHLTKPVNLEQLRAALERWGKAQSTDSVTYPKADMDDNFEVLSMDVVASLRELSDDESDLFAELVELFLEDTPPRLEALHVALSSEDTSALEAAAHGLKSSCANIGALAMSELCRQIEALGRSDVSEGATELVERSEEEFRRVQAALESALAS